MRLRVRQYGKIAVDLKLLGVDLANSHLVRRERSWPALLAALSVGLVGHVSLSSPVLARGGGAFGAGGSGGPGGTGFTGPAGGNGGPGSNCASPLGNAGAGGAGIVGSGLTVINSGTITAGVSGRESPASAITFTGGTNVLELQGGSTITGNVVAFGANDTLRLGGATDCSFDVSQIGPAAQYQNFGLFAKTGTSTWTLSGENDAVLPWTINAGTLTVLGSLANSGMTVNAGGTLSGTGTVGSVTVNSGGTLAPGFGGPGTALAISGNLAFQSGAIYLVQVNRTAASSANVAGTATLTGGNVQAVFSPGLYMTRQYTILHASGRLDGTTFGGISGNVPIGFAESLSYTSTDVVLNLSATLGGGLGINQQNVAGALNKFFNGGGTLPPNFVGVFEMSGGNLANTLSQLSGEAATGAQQSAFQFMGQFLGLMLDPFVDGRDGGGHVDSPALGFAPEQQSALPGDVALAYASAMKAPAYKAPTVLAPSWSVWAGGFGGYNQTNGDPNIGAHDLTARAAGGAAGLDYHLTRDAVIGFALAGGGTNWGLAQGFGGGKSDAFEGGIYGTVRSGAAYVAASVAAANHWMSTDRYAAFADHVSASFDAQSYGGRVEGGYRFSTPIAGVTPYAALQAQRFDTPNYAETDLGGAGFGLSYAARSATDTRSELGARFDRTMLAAPDVLLTLRGSVAWAHDWISDPSLVAVFQTLPGASFIVNGATPAKDNALASVGANLHFANGWALAAKFDGEFAGNSQTYAGTGTLRYTW